MSKRALREGSIYQRKSDGRWCAAMSLGNGKRVSFYGRTQDEVLRKLESAERDRAQGIDFDAGRITVERFAHQYLRSAKMNLRPSSFNQYEFIVRCHIVPHIGNLRLSKVRPHHLQDLYAKSLASGLSATTTRHIHKVAHLLFERAMKWNHIARNPAAAVDPPRIKPREIVMLTQEELNRFCEAARGARYEALFLLAITTGARVSELLGLRWSSIDWDSQLVTISHSLRITSDGPELVEPKTRSSIRKVAIPGQVVSVLRAHQTRQAEHALKSGSVYRNSLDLIFTTATGRAVDRKSLIRSDFRPLLRKAGLDETLRMHDLRHQFATTALANGLPVPLVAQTLGHTNAVTTMRVYAHAVPMTQHQIAGVFEALLPDSKLDSNVGD